MYSSYNVTNGYHECHISTTEAMGWEILALRVEGPFGQSSVVLREEVEEWLDENMEWWDHLISSGMVMIRMKNESDVVAFKLRWI